MIQLEWNTCQMKGLYETLLKHPLILSIKVKGQVKHRSRSGQNDKSWKLGCLMWLLPFSAYSDVITRTKTLCGIFLTVLEKCGQFDWSVAINDRHQYRTQASSCFSCCAGRAVPAWELPTLLVCSSKSCRPISVILGLNDVPEIYLQVLKIWEQWDNTFRRYLR